MSSAEHAHTHRAVGAAMFANCDALERLREWGLEIDHDDREEGAEGGKLVVEPERVAAVLQARRETLESAIYD